MIITFLWMNQATVLKIKKLVYYSIQLAMPPTVIPLATVFFQYIKYIIINTKIK